MRSNVHAMQAVMGNYYQLIVAQLIVAHEGPCNLNVVVTRLMGVQRRLGLVAAATLRSFLPTWMSSNSTQAYFTDPPAPTSSSQIVP